LRMARQLSRAGLAQMVQVVLTREPSGHRVVLTDASSGELSLVVTLLGIASSIRDSSLILIDEPEISLHPQWQVEYLRRLAEAFADYRGCHFVVATHSPTLVSGSDPVRTTIVDLERLTIAAADEPPSRSVDEVLVREFGVTSEGNLYIRQLIVEALRLVADRQTRSQPFITRLALLQDAVKGLSGGSPVHQLVQELGEVGAAGNGVSE
jgi:predicted ATPase